MGIEIIGDATLYLGDCLEIMPTLGKVDAVVTDPPYDGFTHSGGKFGAGAKFGGCEFKPLDDISYVGQLVQLTDAWIVVFCPVETTGKIQSFAVNNYVRGMVWDKINPSPQLSGDRPSQAVEGIALLHGTRKNMKWNGGGKAGIYRYSVERGTKEHQTQKPIKLMKSIVYDYTNKTQIILDPFMGSGTTGVAAVQEGRKFIGIEIDEKYFDIACKRIEEAQRQGRLFT